MKGVIVNCLSKLVRRKFGVEKWQQALERAGKSKFTKYVHAQDVDDAEVLRIIEAVCKVLDLTLAQAADAFGHFWATEFAPELYARYYAKARNARQFLLQMDQVHQEATTSLSNARPPRFTYEEPDDHTLVMTYHSERGLLEIFEGLIRGVGAHFGEQLELERIGDGQVRITFN